VARDRERPPRAVARRTQMLDQGMLLCAEAEYLNFQLH
jgi:hypothetical protein